MIWWQKIVCGLTYEVTGRENIPAGNGIILSKHQSAWETIAFQVIFPAQAWVLKRELLRIPFFGWGLAMTQPVAIDRSEGLKALDSVIKQGQNRLKQGRFVVVFPEGTRTPVGQKGRYNPGGAMLAVRAKVGVLPVAHNAGKYWSRKGFIKRPGVIKVKIGPVIQVAGNRAKQVNQEAERWIEDAVLKIH